MRDRHVLSVGLVVLVASAVGIGTTAVAQASCAMPPPAREAFLERDVAFLGRVVEVTEDLVVVVEVEEVLKGTVPDTVRVSAGDGNQSDYLQERIGETLGFIPYVFGSGFTIGGCGGALYPPDVLRSASQPLPFAEGRAVLVVAADNPPRRLYSLDATGGVVATNDVAHRVHSMAACPEGHRVAVVVGDYNHALAVEVRDTSTLELMERYPLPGGLGRGLGVGCDDPDPVRITAYTRIAVFEISDGEVTPRDLPRRAEAVHRFGDDIVLFDDMGRSTVVHVDGTKTRFELPDRMRVGRSAMQPGGSRLVVIGHPLDQAIQLGGPDQPPTLLVVDPNHPEDPVASASMGGRRVPIITWHGDDLFTLAAEGQVEWLDKDGQFLGRASVDFAGYPAPALLGETMFVIGHPILYRLDFATGEMRPIGAGHFTAANLTALTPPSTLPAIDEISFSNQPTPPDLPEEDPAPDTTVVPRETTTAPAEEEAPPASDLSLLAESPAETKTAASEPLVATEGNSRGTAGLLAIVIAASVTAAGVAVITVTRQRGRRKRSGP